MSDKPNKYTRKRRRQADGRPDIYTEVAHALIKEELREFLLTHIGERADPTPQELRQFGDKCHVFLRNSQRAKQAAWNKNAFKEEEELTGPAAQVIPPEGKRTKWVVRYYAAPDGAGQARLHAVTVHDTEEDAREQAQAWVEVTKE